MSWPTAITDLRTVLSDGPTDKIRANQAIVVGPIDGINGTFKTLDYRRVTAFASSATVFPLGIQINGAYVPAASVINEDLSSGYFQLPPSTVGVNSKFTATFYIQWFIDSELDFFLQQTSLWLGQTTDYVNQTPDGLKDSALKHSCHLAYKKLALKFAEDPAIAALRAQDQKDDKRLDTVSQYQAAANTYWKQANDSRNDYYTRKGQPLAPMFGTVIGGVRNPTRS